MERTNEERVAQRFEELSGYFNHWEKTKDLVDQFIDLILNYRQSGHPGGSRSKAHALIVSLLSGVFRWDIRHPEKRFGDRFVLGAGHTVPLIYCTLAVLNEALRVKYQQTGDDRYLVPNPGERALYWEDLLNFRRRGGLSGHAEMEGKTLFLKFNTGPSGHGSPAAAGAALALKRAGADGSKVLVFEGEAGLTPGAVHETMNSAWGLGLDNLYYVLDWNDFGIDDHPVSSVVYGTPNDWFASQGWRVFGTESGSEWAPVTKTILSMMLADKTDTAPSVAWVKTRKGRDYLKYDNKSHGSPHKIDSELFWETKRPFAEKYGVTFANFGGHAPDDAAARRAEFEANLRAVIEVLHRDQALVDYLADTLVALGDSVPEEIPNFRLGQRGNPFENERLYDYRNYPDDLYVKPGTSVANRGALAKWGAWANAFGAQEYGQPLFVACSADLADSTQVSGFAKEYGDFDGYGWYERHDRPEGVLLPQEITEFANAGILAGMASVNLAADPEETFAGFWGAASTYGAFSYLKYGMMRLYSQLAQDNDLKVGKLLWIAGHSGPETADDSRTHFGIFSPGVTQLFPQGSIINLHPWEHNEVPVLLGAALKQAAPIVALHLTRPAIVVPDREKLGMASHFEAARGAYVARAYRPDQPRGGTLIVQGTSAMASLVDILPELDERGLNVKVVCATSPQLFALQPEAYRRQTLSPEDWVDSTVITTQARWLMHDWLFSKVSEAYALSADWDDRWRTGGTLDELVDEARLSPDWVLEGIQRFVRDREDPTGAGVMADYKIAAIPGDGIGKEVLPEGLKVLHAAADKTGTFRLAVEHFPWGCGHYLETGEVMAEDGIDTLKGFDAIYFGAGGHPEVPDYLSAWKLIFVIRHAFDQYVNLRPIKLLPGVTTPLANVKPEDIDFVIVRENTEGEFAGPGGLVHAGQPHAVAVQTSVFTRQGVEQVARYAFETARERRGQVTNITKSNAVQHSLVFWDQVIGEVSADYPDVAYETMYVDAAAMKFIQEPGRFDVIVTTNLFGDILSDLGAAMMGSIGLAASGNINPDPGQPSMFEPFHGSAPDIAGRGMANPIGAIWAGAMMLDHLGEKEAAGLVLAAISQVLEEGIRTADLGGSASTSQVGDAVTDAVGGL